MSNLIKRFYYIMFYFQTYLVVLLVTMGPPMQFLLTVVALHRVVARGYRMREISNPGEGSSFYLAGQIFLAINNIYIK